MLYNVVKNTIVRFVAVTIYILPLKKIVDALIDIIVTIYNCCQSSFFPIILIFLNIFRNLRNNNLTYSIRE